MQEKEHIARNYIPRSVCLKSGFKTDDFWLNPDIMIC